MCPGHMVEKWRRDLEAASDPAAPIQARIITRPARPEAAWFHAKIAPVLAEYGAVIVSDERWQEPPRGENDSGLRRRLRLTVPIEQRRYLMDRLARLLTVQGRGSNASHRPSLRSTSDGLVVECQDRDDYTLADFFRDYDQGRLGKKAVAVVAFEPAKYDAGIQAIDLPHRWLRLWDEQAGENTIARAPCCPDCGQPFGVAVDGGRLVAAAKLAPLGRHFELLPNVPSVCPHVSSEPVLGDDGHVVMQGDRPVLAQRPCGTRLYSLSRWRRVGLSRLVQRQYAHRFRVYVADEVHESAPRSCTH